MKSVMLKTTFREIRLSFGRYMAILAIVALGVGFFAGLKATKPAMTDAVETYFNALNFYDFRLLSTLGFDEKDIEVFQEQKGVETAAGSYSFDIICESSFDENSFVVKAHSITEGVNTLFLTAGRMPEKVSECVVDSLLYSDAQIGQKIILSSENDEEDTEHFKQKEFTIVGIAQSPLYIQFERGNTSLGNGMISGFLYLLPEAFDSEAYTEIYIKFDRDFPLHSEQYNEFIEEKEADWTLILKEAASRRADEIRQEADEKLAEAQEELKFEREKAQKELDDAKKQIEEGKAELEAAKEELEAGWEELRKQEKKIAEGEKELNENETLLIQKEAELDAGILTWQENNKVLMDSKTQLRVAESEISTQENQLSYAEQQMALLDVIIDLLQEQIEDKEAELLVREQELNHREQQAASVAELAEIAALRIELEEERTAVESWKRMLNEELLPQYESYEKQVADGRKQLEEAKAQVIAGWAQLDQGEQELEHAWTDIINGRAQIDAGKTQIATARKEIADGRLQITEAKETLENGEEEIIKGRQELADGEKEYQEGLKEFEEKMAEAEAELLDAKRKVKEINDPDTYVLGRNTNVGYVCFESDSNIVEDVAKVFPIFFFLVAALVCMTTMSRMIEEQRTQIGVLKGLGYSEWTIMSKYLIYSGSAALIGCLIGFFLLTYIFPMVIWFCYGIMYDVTPVSYYFSWQMLVIGVVVSLLCSVGTTWYCCRNELKEVAAQLMRPKTPEAGKRIFLEKVDFIWKRLKFLQKVSIRNVFRYKKRFFMMIIGISGCTSLIIAGLGLNDSVKGIIEQQFTQIMKYDMSVTFSDEITSQILEEFEEITDGKRDSYTVVMENSLDLKVDDVTKALNLIVFQDTGAVSEYMDLHTKKGEKLPFPGTGQVVITHKLAETYGIVKGSSVTLTDDSQKELTATVSGVNENFVMNYVFMNEDTYEQALDKPVEFKTIYLNISKDGAVDMHQLSADIMEMYEVAAVTINQDSMDRLNAMMGSLDYIVGLVILCAAALAFIVLYNLTNINITERVREIATVKVLGFYKKETSSYVFRENMMLTVIGALIGLVLGKVLHKFVMDCVKVDMVSFDTKINAVSYVYAVILTYIFAALVNLMMRKKIEKISMTESLKSVD